MDIMARWSGVRLPSVIQGTLKLDYDKCNREKVLGKEPR